MTSEGACVRAGLLGLLVISGCGSPRGSAPPGGWYAAHKAMSCDPAKHEIDWSRELPPAALERPDVQAAIQRAEACSACLKASCCSELQGCDRDAFPPDSTLRKEAARCGCLLRCGVRRPLSVCAARCGAENDLYRAAGACAAAHCSEICTNGAP
jgi:hypothetical protein